MNIENYIDQIINADCMEILSSLPDKCVDLVLTDPPYGNGNQQKINRIGGRNKICARNVSRTGGTWASKYTNKIVHWDTPPTQEVFDQMFRVSKNQIIWGGNYFSLPPTRCFNVWRKLSIGENFTMAMAEYAWCSHNANAKVYEIAPQNSLRFHPTQKPVQLFDKQLLEYTKEGDIVLDPFSGSATTAIACMETGRHYICVEKDKEYYELSCQRVEDYKKQMTFSFMYAPEQKQLDI